MLHETVGFGMLLPKSIVFSAGAPGQFLIKQVAVKVVFVCRLSIVSTEPVTPVDQWMVPPSQPVAVKLTVPPGHTLLLLAMIVGFGASITIIVIGLEAGLVQEPTTQLAV